MPSLALDRHETDLTVLSLELNRLAGHAESHLEFRTNRNPLDMRPHDVREEMVPLVTAVIANLLAQ